MADLLAPLPMIVLKSGQSIRFEAIDPTTGLDVAGVTIAAATIYAAVGAASDGSPTDFAFFLTDRDD